MTDGIPNFFSSIFLQRSRIFDPILRTFADPHHFLNVDPDPKRILPFIEEVEYGLVSTYMEVHDLMCWQFPLTEIFFVLNFIHTMGIMYGGTVPLDLDTYRIHLPV
jgi:hypothetical protein